MSSRSPGPGAPAPQRCQLILQRCVAIQLAKPGNAPDDFWMYDSGYLLFQGFLSANSQCWWVSSLGAACRGLRYAGYVAPGLLLVSGDPCALEVVRSAYSRSVLKPPPSYLICGLGDIDDCIVTPAYQGQFTPLPEALCDVIMDITAQGQSATMENIRQQLASKFPSMQSPSADVVYDTLAQLSQQGHLYQTARGYFIVTPERRRCRRSRSQPERRPSRSAGRGPDGDGVEGEGAEGGAERAGLLLSAQEALHSLYGEISTIRDGALTHQCIQTNLADVISGGNPNDKILYGRAGKRRSASLPAGRSPERRGGRSWGGSVRHLPPSGVPTVTDADVVVADSSPKKGSLLSRLFRRSGRNKQARGSIKSFSAQFPPAEWFNSKAVHLHCVATQTISKESLQSLPSYVSSYYDGSEISQRSMTLSRHRRHLSTESTLLPSSNAQYSSSLPRTALSSSFTEKHTSENSPTHRNGNIKVRESPCGSLKRQKYLQSGNAMSTSGPSSLESNHRGSMKTLKNDSKSASSSLESHSLINRYPRSQTNSSGHSTFESHYSDRTLQPSPSHCGSHFGTIGLSRAQSLVKVQSLQSSPKSLHKKRKPTVTGADIPKTSNTSTPQSSPKITSSTPKNSPNSNSSGNNAKPEPNKCDSSSTAVSANSSSNNSITLKLTTNTTAQNGAGTNTKVYVQNSPARSVITFENGNLTEASKGNNIFIFNDDRYSMTKPSIDDEKLHKAPLNVFMETTLDNFPVQKSEHFTAEPYYPNNETVKVQETKFNKNVINDKSMNNNRKLSLQLGNNQSNNGLSYKNQLKNPAETVSSPGTPAIHNNTVGLDAIGNSDSTTPTKSFDNLVDSIGNLRYYEKNNLTSANSQHESQKLKSNGDLKSVDLMMKAAAMQASNRKSLYHSRMSSDSIASILSKSSDNKSTAIGSEPNLVFKNQDSQNSPSKETNSSVEMNGEDSNKKQKRYSLSQEIKNRNPEFYNFPSLSDLSFNFTSLAAQKILKGVSINSVDTLNELNMAANGTDKQKNCEVTVCTDFGLV